MKIVSFFFFFSLWVREREKSDNFSSHCYRSTSSRQMTSDIDIDNCLTLRGWYVAMILLIFFCCTFKNSLCFIVFKKSCFIWILLSLFETCQNYDFRYHNYSEMTAFLHDIAVRFPTTAALFDIGKTEKGTNKIIYF